MSNADQHRSMLIKILESILNISQYRSKQHWSSLVSIVIATEKIWSALNFIDWHGIYQPRSSLVNTGQLTVSCKFWYILVTKCTHYMFAVSQTMHLLILRVYGHLSSFLLDYCIDKLPSEACVQLGWRFLTGHHGCYTKQYDSSFPHPARCDNPLPSICSID